jgi:hypothetical protein
MRFLCKENRFLRQAHQEFPEYVLADPDHPAPVDMPDNVRVFDHAQKKKDLEDGKVKADSDYWRTVPFSDPRLIPYTPETEERPHLIPAHADLKQEPVPSAARLQGPTPTAPKKSGRLADA